jgi:uncharacterized protein YggE
MILRSLIVALCSCASLMASLHDVPHISLSSQAKIKKPADEIQLKITVTTLAKTASEGLEDNSLKMRSIISSLKNIGLDDDEYETLQFTVNPTYTPYPKNPPSDWQPTINGYQIINSLYVHTTQIEKIGEIIDTTAADGATQISDLRFGIRDPKQYWNEVLTSAASNAIKDAKTLASVTGVELVRILQLTLSQFHVSSPQMHVACFSKAAMNSSTPIEAGDVAIEATVNLLYEIK